MSDLQSRNRDRLMQAQARYFDRLQPTQASQTAYFTGQIANGKYQLRDEQGNVFYASPITNGGIATGGKVQVIRQGGQTLFDQMPS